MAEKWQLRLVRRLHGEQEGLCYWCGRSCLLPEQLGYLRPKGVPSGRAATLDHLFSKLNPMRQRSVVISKYVMACASCNRKRSRQEVEEYRKLGTVVTDPQMPLEDA